MKKCPFCAESIQDEAVVCRFCNRELKVADDLSASAVQSEKKDPAPIPWNRVDWKAPCPLNWKQIALIAMVAGFAAWYIMRDGGFTAWLIK